MILTMFKDKEPIGSRDEKRLLLGLNGRSAGI
jgi:hypothetical protein